jgi:glutamate decarboxylase
MSTHQYCSRKHEDLQQVFGEIAKMAANYVTDHYKYETTKVINFVPPEELKKIIDFSLPVEGVGITPDLSSIKSYLDKVLQYSVRTGSPRYFNQLWSGTDIACIIAEWISAFTNSSTYTYEVAPVYSLMEIELINHLLRYIGWEDGDGVLASGGATCNLMGILCARDKLFPETKSHGNPEGKKLVAFTSAHSHYTIKRSTWMMGLGLDAAINVSVNSEGKMDPQALDEAITKAKEEGLTPFCVNATAGSTVLGVFDDIEAIADICEKHKVWLHVDAAWGGTVLVSRKWRHLMRGIHRADSVTWCLHKMMGINQQCAAILLKEPNSLKRVNASHADYLFHFDDTRPYDLGEKTLNCGRHQDSFKAWLSWKVHGDLGMEARVDKNFENRTYFVEQLKSPRWADRFELLFEPECTQVCFFYLPKAIRGMPKSKERDNLCGKFVRLLRRRVQISGSMLVNYNPLSASEPHFEFVPDHWRIVFANPEQTKEDLDFVLTELDRLGEAMQVDEEVVHSDA